MTTDTKNYKNGGYKKPFSPKVHARKEHQEQEKAIPETTVDVNETKMVEEPVSMKHYGVLTGIKYSDLDIKKNQMPECVFEGPDNMTEKEIAEKAFVERLERKCSDCKACSSYNYYL